VLAIGAETLSRYVDMQDRSTCILFGDGAGAAVVTPYEECEQGEILETTLGADGSGYELIHMPMGGGKTPHHHPDYDPRGNYIGLRGREVFRFAVTKMTELIEKVTEGIDRSKVGLLVPHQVNRRIIDSALERLGWDESRCVINIEKYGNTSAASVPIALDEAHRAGTSRARPVRLSWSLSAQDSPGAPRSCAGRLRVETNVSEPAILFPDRERSSRAWARLGGALRRGRARFEEAERILGFPCARSAGRAGTKSIAPNGAAGDLHHRCCDPLRARRERSRYDEGRDDGRALARRVHRTLVRRLPRLR
jgi:hypothetical protein